VMNPIMGEAPTQVQKLPNSTDNREVYEQVNHLLTVALMDLRAGDLEVVEEEMLEAQRLIYDLMR
jgi:hypothetical protein